MNILWKLKPKVKLFTDFFVFDTETGERFPDGSIQWHLKARPESFIFGVIYGHNFSKVIHSLDEFKKELLDPRYKDKYVFAHNLEYDLGVCYGNVIQDLDNKAIFNGSKLIAATNGNCRFADSTNIFGRISLKEIGRMIGIEKPDLGDANLFSQSLGPKEINRCFEDCHILFDALLEMFEFAGDIKITQASLSMTYYRRFHQPYNIEHNENTKYFWSSYYGGRTEVFKLGKTHSQVIDINSSYPYAMKNSVFPNPQFLKHSLDVSVKRFVGYYLKSFEGCARVTVNHPEKWIGFLPYKAEDGKLLFPVGEFTGWYNFNELRFAIENGIEIIKVYEVVYAPAMESPFVSYVNDLYTQRFSTDNEFEIYRIKIYMNSLYGKFAMRLTQEQIYIPDIETSYELIKSYQDKNLLIKLQMFNSQRRDCFLIVKSLVGKNLPYSIPSFSSYITSFARVHLLKKLLELEKFRPVYCDTDSIFYEIEDTSFSNDKGLGGWKLENKIITEVRGLKNYKFITPPTTPGPSLEGGVQEKWRLKGVPKRAKQIGPNMFEYSNLIKTKEGLKRNIDSGILTKRIKEITGEYTKRIILDKGETKPIKIK